MYTKGGCHNPFGNILVPKATGPAQCRAGFSVSIEPRRLARTVSFQKAENFAE